MKACIVLSAVLMVACFALSDAQERSECQIVCLAVYTPVCAKDAQGATRTFSNSCYLDIHNECTDPDHKYEQIYEGECKNKQ